MGDKNFDEAYFQGEGSGYVPGYKLDFSLEQFFRKMIAKIQRHKKKQGIKICDIGCAYGFFLKLCEEQGWTTFGADISSHAIIEAKKITKAELKVHDIRDGVAFPLEQFDVITCFEVVEHLENPTKGNHIYQNLAGQGIILISTPNPKSYFYRKPLFHFRDRDTSHISLKTPKQWKQLLRANGFKILSSQTTFYSGQSKRLIGKVWEIVSKLLGAIGLGAKTEIVAIKLPDS